MPNHFAPLHPLTALAFALPLVLSGCAASHGNRAAQPGDEVRLHFTCRLPNGEVASTSDPAVARDASIAKGSIFLPPSSDAALLLPRGQELEELRNRRPRAMEEEILSQLVDRTLGKRPGDILEVKLTATDAPAGENQPLTLAQVRKRAKELRIPVEEYRARKHADPVVGQPFTIDPAFPGKVAKVTEHEVTVEFSPSAPSVPTTFGVGVVTEKEDHYEVAIKTEPGKLVRNGPLVGRVVSADGTNFTVDYGNPFAGEELRCQVRVVSVEPAPVPLPPPPAAARSAVEGKDAAASAKVEAPAGPTKVAAGDLVRVSFTASLESGEVFATNRESVVRDPAVRKTAWFQASPSLVPEEVVAGNREFFPGLAESTVGMAVGERRRVVLPPEKGFGPVDQNKRVKIPCSRTIPLVFTMTAEEFGKQFGTFPVKDKEFSLVPYFKSRVKEVGEREVTMENLAHDDEAHEPFGTVSIRVTGDRIETVLRPELGAPFPVPSGTGIIVETDGETFIVDTNNPLAGKTLVLDLEVVSAAHDASLPPITWVEGYDQALAVARDTGKPVFLLLYADWCAWCKKTFAETLPDPRIGRLRDRFVWAKVNSDQETKIKELFHQDGFPLMLVLKPDGTVVKRIDGYRDARALKAELDGEL